MQGEVVIPYPAVVPMGFKFKPLDSELIAEYLKRKIENSNGFHVHFIPEVNIYNFHPEYLLGGFPEGEKDAYFFSLREKKHEHGTRVDRCLKDKSGFWNKSIAREEVTMGGTIIGHKSGFNFYNGKSKAKAGKTKWIMKEFEISECDGNNQCTDDWVICHIYERTENDKN